MYRDYFETDVEFDQEDDYIEEKLDELHIAETGQLNPKLYDFIDYTAKHDAHENYEEKWKKICIKYITRERVSLNKFLQREDKN